MKIFFITIQERIVLLIVLCSLISVFNPASGQKPVIKWKTDMGSGNYLNARVGLDYDGHVLRSYTSGNSVLIEKFEVTNGTRIWTKNLLIGDAPSFCTSLQKTPDGGYILTGRTSSTNLPGLANRGDMDGILVKLDSDFTIVWQKVIGGSGEDGVANIRLLKEGGYVIVGYTNSSDGDWTSGEALGSYDVFVMKLDNSGDIIWKQRYGGSGRDGKCVDATLDYPLDIQQDTLNGGYIVAAETGSEDGHIIFGGNTRKAEEPYAFSDPPNQTMDTWVFKLNDDGILQWSKCYGGTKRQTPASVLVTASGDYVIAVASTSQDGDITGFKGGTRNDIWLVWIDPNGVILHEKSYGGEGHEAAFEMYHAQGGGYILIGQTESRMMDIDDNTAPVNTTSFLRTHPWILKLREDRTIEWSKFMFPATSIESNDDPAGVQTEDGEFVITSQYWISKLSGCPAYDQRTVNICEGESYDFYGTTLTEPGVYYDTLGQGSDCPNYIELTLKVRPAHYTPVITANGNILTTTEEFATYQWFVNGVPVSWGKKSTFITDGSADYKVAVVDVAGCVSDTTGSYSFFYDGCEAPAVEWTRSYGGTGTDEVNSITAVSDGYLLAGRTNSANGDVAGLHGTAYDFWIVKIDNNGDTLWTKTLGGNGIDNGYAVRATTDGGFVVVGQSATNATLGDVTASRPVASSSTDIWVIKFSGSGTIEWQHLYGGTGTENVYSIEVVSDGYIIGGSVPNSSVTGTLTGTTSNGNNDGWILKLKTDGTLDWQKRLGGGGIEHIYTVKPTLEGGYIAAGYSSYAAATGTLGTTPRPVTGNSGQDAWVLKLDSEGETEWQLLMGGAAPDQASAVKQVADGGYLVAGYAGNTSSNGTLTGINKPGGNDFWIVKLNASGVIQWQQALGGSASDQALSADIQEESDGYVFSGLTASVDGIVTGNRGGNDYWIVKTDFNGNVQWQKTLGGTTADQVSAHTIANGGGYIIAGYAGGNGGISDAKGGTDFYIVKLAGCRTCTTPTYTSICEGSEYNFGGTVVTSAGVYKDTSDVEGCRSIQALELKVDPVYTTPLSHAICAGDGYNFYGTVLQEAGTFTHLLTTSKGCDSTLSLTITLNVLPVPLIVSTGNELSTGTYSAYEWLLDGGSTGQTSQTITAVEEGNYKVVVTDANGCSDTSSVYSVATTGVWNGKEGRQVTVFPNPAGNELMVSVPALYEASYEVIFSSVDGREVWKKTHSGNRAVLDIHELSQGVYLMKIYEKGELKSIQRVIKK